MKNNVRIKAIKMTRIADFIDGLYNEIDSLKEEVKRYTEMSEDERPFYAETTIVGNGERIIALEQLIKDLER